MKKSSTFPRLACAAAVVAVLAASGADAAVQTGAVRRPDLTGEWQLNRDLSEDAHEKLQGMMGAGAHAAHE